MQKPDILVHAEKATVQLGPQALAMWGVTSGEMWTFTVTCPHATFTHHALLRPCDGSGGCQHDGHAPTGDTQALAEETCEQIRTVHFQKAPCACSEPYWLKHGPIYDMKIHIGADQMMGPAPKDCFSKN